MFADWQKYVKDNKELAAGVQVLLQINKAGYKAYIVGGPVRDIIQSKTKNEELAQYVADLMQQRQASDIFFTKGQVTRI